jgi:predicted MFS family arabinose efflux permease
MVSNVGFSEASLAYIYLVGGGLTIFTSPLVGRLADRFGRARVFTVASIVMIAPNLIVTNMGPMPIWNALIITAVWFVFGNARFVPSMAMITSVVPPRTRGGFMSINSSLQSVASGSAAFVAGLIIERSAEGKILHYDVLGYMSVALAFVALYIGRRLKPSGDD